MRITDLYIVESQGQDFFALLDEGDDTAYLSPTLPAQMLSDTFNSIQSLVLEPLNSKKLELWTLPTTGSTPEFQYLEDGVTSSMSAINAKELRTKSCVNIIFSNQNAQSIFERKIRSNWRERSLESLDI